MCLLWCPNVSLECVLLSTVHVHQCLTKKILMIVCPECTWLILKTYSYFWGYFFIILWLLSGKHTLVSFECSVVNSVLSVFWPESFNSSELFYKCRIIGLGANCDQGECVFQVILRTFTIWPNHIVRRKTDCARKVNRNTERGQTLTNPLSPQLHAKHLSDLSISRCVHSYICMKPLL